MPTLKIHGIELDVRSIERNLRKLRRSKGKPNEARRVLTIANSKVTR